MTPAIPDPPTDITTTPHDPASLTRVLQALRDTAPTPGLEARLLHTLAAHHAQPATPPLSLAHPLRWLAISTLALATAATLLVTLHHETSPATSRPTSSSAERSKPPFQAAVLSTEAKRRGDTPISTTPTLSHAPRPTTTQVIPPETPSTLARVEAAAPSQPPPPLPITAEERQIQRFAGRHNAFALAALSPATEPAHQAADRQAFTDFFEPTPPPSTPPTTNPPTN